MAIRKLHEPDDEDEIFDVDQFKGYRESDEVAAVALRLVTRERVHFGRLRDFEIRYAVLCGKKPKPDSELDVLAKFVKVPALYRDLFAADAIVWVNEALWNALDERQKEACVAHELSHGDVYVVAADDAASAIDKAKVVARRAGWTVRTLCSVRPESKGRCRVELAVVRPEAVSA